MEMRERLADSNYWQTRRKVRKIISNGTIIVKECFDLGWIIYGSILYWSPAAKGCSNDNTGFIFIMFLFIIIGLLKIILFVVVLGIIVYIFI